MNGLNLLKKGESLLLEEKYQEAITWFEKAREVFREAGCDEGFQAAL